MDKYEQLSYLGGTKGDKAYMKSRKKTIGLYPIMAVLLLIITGCVGVFVTNEEIKKQKNDKASLMNRVNLLKSTNTLISTEINSMQLTKANFISSFEFKNEKIEQINADINDTKGNITYMNEVLVNKTSIHKSNEQTLQQLQSTIKANEDKLTALLNKLISHNNHYNSSNIIDSVAEYENIVALTSQKYKRNVTLTSVNDNYIDVINSNAFVILFQNEMYQRYGVSCLNDDSCYLFQMEINNNKPSIVEVHSNMFKRNTSNNQNVFIMNKDNTVITLSLANTLLNIDSNIKQSKYNNINIEMYKII
jgi:hypothetical protein